MYVGTNPKALNSVRSIERALITLMRKMPYESISVTAICQEAGVSRPTFYKNFEGKNEVVGYIINRVFKESVSEFNPDMAGQRDYAIRHIVQTFARNEELLSPIRNTNLQNAFLQQVLAAARSNITPLVDSHWSHETLDYIYTFYLGGMIQLFAYWREQEQMLSENDFCDLLLGISDRLYCAVEK